MNRIKSILVLAIVLGVVSSTAGAYPLTNVVTGNDAGWFTTDNIQEYGDDLDSRVEPDDRVLTGHPSYVAASDARLLFDMPRIHYFATTFNDSTLGDEFYANLTRAIHEGDASYAISGTMTKRMLEQNQTAASEFQSHYCEVDNQSLYQDTNATLYRWQPAGDCPSDRQPVIERFSNETSGH